MFNMFVIALEPFKSHCYLKKKLFRSRHRYRDIGQVSPLTYFRNRDIVYGRRGSARYLVTPYDPIQQYCAVGKKTQSYQRTVRGFD